MIAIELTGGGVAFVDDEDADLATLKWHVRPTSKTAYARHAKRVSPTITVHVHLHQVVAQRMGIAGMADHRDRDGLNCCRSNLRAANKSQNAANEGMRRSNTTGYRGVSPYFGRAKRFLKWQVKIQINGCKTHVGYFDDVIEAAKAYDARAREAFGEFASLNFP